MTVVLGVMAMLAVGYVIASVMKTVTSVNAVTNLVAFPMIFLGGSYFPLDPPQALVPVINVIPLTHLNDALREVAYQAVRTNCEFPFAKDFDGDVSRAVGARRDPSSGLPDWFSARVRVVTA